MSNEERAETVEIFEGVSCVVDLLKNNKFMRASKKFKNVIDYIYNSKTYSEAEQIDLLIYFQKYIDEYFKSVEKEFNEYVNKSKYGDTDFRVVFGVSIYSHNIITQIKKDIRRRNKN